jgi:putative ABC transport system permease protein
VQALTEAAIPPVSIGPTRRLLAYVFAAGTVALAGSTMFMDRETAAATGGPATLTGSIAVGLLGPEIIAFVASRWSRRWLRTSELPNVNIRTRAHQFATVLTPITLATAITLGNIYSTTTMNDAYVDHHVDQFSADAVINSSSGVIAPELVDRVRQTPGVRAVSALATSKGWLERPYDGRGSEPLPLLGIGAPDGYTVPVTAGSLTNLTGPTVAIPEELREDTGVKLGDRVTMRLGDGAQVDVTVVALLDVSLDYAALVLPVDLLAPHTTAGLPTQLLVKGDNVVAPIAERIKEFPGTVVGGGGMLEENFAAGLDITAFINYLLAVLAIAYAAIAAVNTLAVSVLSRRRELAAQRLAGATRRQVRRMLLTEVSVIVLIALVLGTVISLFTVVPTAFASGEILPSGPIWVFLATITVAFLICWPVTLAASRLAMRKKAIDTINSPVE